MTDVERIQQLEKDIERQEKALFDLQVEHGNVISILQKMQAQMQHIRRQAHGAVVQNGLN